MGFLLFFFCFLTPHQESGDHFTVRHSRWSPLSEGVQKPVLYIFSHKGKQEKEPILKSVKSGVEGLQTSAERGVSLGTKEAFSTTSSRQKKNNMGFG